MEFNYFIGNNPAKWLNAVPTFKSIRYLNVYDEIDLKFYGNSRQLEYDVIINPGGKPHQVSFHLKGARSLEINQENGHIVGDKEAKKLWSREYEKGWEMKL